MADNKDIIYIDIDDEITTVIDKVRGSGSKVVALVLPKRAATLQSIINMKLLKRASDESKKNLVLITTETGLLPLAGAVGLHVAATPNSRPEIPASPVFSNDEEQIDETDELLDDELPAATLATAGTMPIGQLADAATAKPVKPGIDSGIETVELDNIDATPPASAASPVAKQPKPKKDKKLAVPNFDRFRLILILGVVLILLLSIGGYVALAVLPKATIDIKTNASNINTDVDFSLNTKATSLNTATQIVPAMQVQTQKTLTGNAPATGQKNNGDKAGGQVTMNAGSCSANIPANLPSGTGLSANGKTYITQNQTTFTPAQQGNRCVYRSSGNTDIKAQSGGASSNVENGTSFTVAGRSEITATGSASGGTDDIKTIIAQADIDAAKAKIAATTSAQDELSSQLEDQNLYAIEATYTAGNPATTNSAEVGNEASTVTVTQTITFTMLGASLDDIKKLVTEDIKSQIDASAQGILSEGITQTAFKLKEATVTGAAMNVQTTAEVGPDINVSTVASNAAGKKSNEIRSSIQSNPDVTDVTVKLSPFWVTKAPKASKITVNVAKPSNAADAN